MARPQDSESMLLGALTFQSLYCRLTETSLRSRSGFGISWNIELATFFECLYFQLAKLNFSSHFASFKAWISSPEIGAIFVHFSTLMSAIYRIFIYVWGNNIAYVVLFQNLGSLKTNTTKKKTSPCVTKTVTVGFFLLWLFYSKNSDNLFNSMIFNMLYLEK